MSTNDTSDLARDWPEPRNFRRSIRLEFSLYVSAIILLLMTVTGYVITDQYVKTVSRNVVDKLLVQARAYSGTAGKLIIAANGPDALLLNNTCKRLQADSPDIYWAGIAGTDGVFLAHTDLRQVIGGARMPQFRTDVSREGMREGEQFDVRSDTIYIAEPISENGMRIGTFLAASSAAPIAEARHLSIVSVTSITAIMMLIGLPFTTILVNRKLRPITVISNRLKQVDFEDLKIDVPVSGRNEFGFLAETLRVMGAKLNLAQRGLIEKERIARELEIAREIQANILPRRYPSGRSFEFAGTYDSALEVGGDYYDFIEFDDRHLGFLVADVSGKSLPGMLVMLITRDIVKRLSRTILPPDRMLTELNRELLPNIHKGMFVTMFYGLLDCVTGTFTFASAGHNPLIHLDGVTGEVDLIKTKGFPLGMMPDEQFDERIEAGRLTLQPGDWLVQYTDGINEAQNAASDEFGMDRLVEAVRKADRTTPSGLIQGILGPHRAFVGEAPQYDDITLLGMKWTGVAADKERRREDQTTRAH